MKAVLCLSPLRRSPLDILVPSPRGGARPADPFGRGCLKTLQVYAFSFGIQFVGLYSATLFKYTSFFKALHFFTFFIK